jgi:beta-aspartyl-peptidase (threonine type)
MIVLIHAGAGALDPDAERMEEIRRELRRVLDAAASALQAGDPAVDVAAGCVAAMEDCALFNAGTGSALCSDGTVQMSAAVMRGGDRGGGAVAGVRSARNPIRVAQQVLGSPQVLVIGEAADALAADAGLELLPNEAFVTERQRARLKAGAPGPTGTVGAVCRDAQGGLAAATSTGGIMRQPPGRVGDSPLLGAGTWADRHTAVSCTGDGEAFIRAAVARTLALRVSEGALALTEAADRGLGEVASLGGTGGLIAIDAAGTIAMPFTTGAMPRGLWRPGGEPQVWLGA